MQKKRIDIAHIAELAGLKLSEEESERFAKQLEDILTHFEHIAEIDTEGVEPLIHPVLLGNVTRNDNRGDSTPRKEMLANAPDADDGNYITPRVVK